MNKRNSYRTAQFKTREESDTGDLILSGYFIKFDEVTELWPGYFEVIKREGVEKAIKGADIRALFNHDDSLVLGRTGNGTVTLGVDEIGLFGEIIINKEDPQAIGAYARVQRGDVDQCSFGFNIIEESTEFREDGTIKWTIEKIDLHEVSIVTFPAYEATSVQARKRDFENLQNRTLEVRKKQLKEKLTHAKTTHAPSQN